MPGSRVLNRPETGEYPPMDASAGPCAAGVEPVDGVPPDTPGRRCDLRVRLAGSDAVAARFVTHTTQCPAVGPAAPSGNVGSAPQQRDTPPEEHPMKKTGRKFSKAAESFVEAIGILGGWNRGRRRSRSRR